MKKPLLLTFGILFFLLLTSLAQPSVSSEPLSEEISTVEGIPQGFNYQAVIRDAKGNALINRRIGLKVHIMPGEGVGSEYVERHWVKTNEFGQVNFKGLFFSLTLSLHFDITSDAMLQFGQPFSITASLFVLATDLIIVL